MPTPVRMDRLARREASRFGRADPGFMAWAAQYDTGGLAGRSLARHQAWLAERRCPVLRLDGDQPVPALSSFLVRGPANATV